MKKKIKNSSKVQKLALPMFSAFDVNGSYTGNPTNGTVITGTPAAVILLRHLTIRQVLPSHLAA